MGSPNSEGSYGPSGLSPSRSYMVFIPTHHVSPTKNISRVDHQIAMLPVLNRKKSATQYQVPGPTPRAEPPPAVSWSLAQLSHMKERSQLPSIGVLPWSIAKQLTKVINTVFTEETGPATNPGTHFPPGLVYAILAINPRASCTLSKHSTDILCPVFLGLNQETHFEKHWPRVRNKIG